MGELLCEGRHIAVLQTQIQTLKCMEVEVRQMEIVGRSDDVSRTRSERTDGVGGTPETGGEHQEVESRGIACEAL